MQVEAGDVLHDAGPALDVPSITGDQFHLDDRVPHASHAELSHRVDAGCDDATHGGVVALVDGPLLPAFGEQEPQVPQPHARVDHH